jgi:hypothetical protein
MTKNNDNEKKPISQAKNHEIMNDIRAQASSEYKSLIPEANAQNFAALGTALTTYTPSMNEFLSALVNRIAMTIVSNKMARNKLAPFKKGTLPFGKDIEEIFTDLAVKATFDPAAAETTVFQRVIPNTKAIFHRENRRDFYKVTISNDMLKKAFLNETGLGQLTSTIIDSLYSADKNDEFKLMKELFTDYTANFTNVAVAAAPTDTATSKAFAQLLKKTVLRMGFMSTAYNKQAVNTFTDPSDLVLFLTPDVATMMDTELLAYAFNAEKFDTNTQIVIVDNFGTGLPKTQAVLVDKDWFMVYDTNFETTSQINAQGLYTNFFLHHWQTLSTSQFKNAVAFNTP